MEKVTNSISQPQAVFKVRALTRCTGPLEGARQSFLWPLAPQEGTWPVALETPLCASGISALRHRISHARVSMQLAI